MSAAIVTPISTRADFARRICERLGQAVEAVIDVGTMLIQAKAELGHGTFESMVREDLDWSPQTARRFMAIARHPALSNRTHWTRLPASWRSLSELARVEPELIEAKIEDGTIRSDMTRQDTKRVVNDSARVRERERERAERLAQQEREREGLVPMTAEDVEGVMGPPPQLEPAYILKDLAEDVAGLIWAIEKLHKSTEDAIESGAFGTPRPRKGKGSRKQTMNTADDLQMMARLLYTAHDALGDHYDYLAGACGLLPMREQA